MNTIALSAEAVKVLAKAIQSRYTKMRRVYFAEYKKLAWGEPFAEGSRGYKALDELCQLSELMMSISDIANGYGIKIEWRK